MRRVRKEKDEEAEAREQKQGTQKRGEFETQQVEKEG